MKQNFQRAVAFFMVIIMILTMSNWSGLVDVAKADTTQTVYFYNSTGWTDVYLYAYHNTGNSGWKDTQAQPDASMGEGWYSCTLDTSIGYAGFLFHNGYDNTAAAEFKKSPDFSVADNKWYIVYESDNGGDTAGIAASYADQAAAIAAAEALSSSDITVYFYNSAEWATVYFYAWDNTGNNSGWKNTQVQLDNTMGAGWYSCTLDASAGYTGFLFHNGYDNTDAAEFKKSSDFIVAENKWYIVYETDNGGNTAGGATSYADRVTAIAAANKLTESPEEGDDTFTVHFYNGNSWTTPYLWAWKADGTSVDTTWAAGYPGAAMQTDSTLGSNWYSSTVPGLNECVGFQVHNNDGTYYNVEGAGYQKQAEQWVVAIGGNIQLVNSKAEADALINYVPTGTLQLHYYAGYDGDRIRYNADNPYAGFSDDGAESYKNMWTWIKADVYCYYKGSYERTYLKTIDFTAESGAQQGWFTADTGLDADNPGYENGLFVEFYGADAQGREARTSTYQFTNNYRSWVTNQMTAFKTPEAAVESLKNSGASYEDSVLEGTKRVWFYHAGGWNKYYVKYDNGSTTMTAEQAYTSDNGGSWYYANIPEDSTYIYFAESADAQQGDVHTSETYDISGITATELFCVESSKIIANACSTSPVEIVNYYKLSNAPSSGEINLPITILDYSGDNLFFEFDHQYLKNMTMIFGSADKYGMSNLGVSGTDGGMIIASDNRPGNIPYYDRNGKEYVTGVLEDELVNGYPVYRKEAVMYIAKVVQKGFQYYRTDKAIGTWQQYNKTKLFESLYTILNANGSLDTVIDEAAYQASAAKYAAYVNNNTLSGYVMTSDTTLTCMDYAYYVLNNLYNTNSTYNQDYGIYHYLTLKRTGENIYGFYANYSTDLPTSYNLRQNYGESGIIYDTENGVIRNNTSGTQAYWDGDYDWAGFAGFFPYSYENLITVSGSTWTELLQYKNVHYGYGWGSDNNDTSGEQGWNQAGEQHVLHDQYGKYNYYTYVKDGKAYEVEHNVYPNNLDAGVGERNYGFTMKASGKFRYSEADDLYFTFTGDDDVALYIKGKKVLDLSGAHEAASYTVYISDLVADGIVSIAEGEYVSFDFFYMERHTSWANLRIESNISLLDATGQVKKRAYELTADGTNVILPSGTVKETGTKVYYEYELTAGGSGMKDLHFVDESLGIDISEEGIQLGTYPVKNADGTTTDVPRSVTELTVLVGSKTYSQGSITTEEQLKEILKTGIQAGENIVISGFPYVLNNGISGTVEATMTADNANANELHSNDSHTLYVTSPSIHVTKKAYSESGEELPNNTVVQSGEKAYYTIELTNVGQSPLYGMSVKDEGLGIDIQMGTDGKVSKVELIGEAATAPLQVTVRGMGVFTAIVTGAEELEQLMNQIGTMVYSTGASLEISGIPHTIVQEFTSTAVGTAHSMTDFTDVAALSTYFNAYMNYKKGLLTEEPALASYVEEAALTDSMKIYINEYKAMLDTMAPGMDLTGYTGSVPSVDAFEKGSDVEDTSELTLSAKQSNYRYYAQANQTIELDLGGNEVTLEASASEQTAAIPGTVEITAGNHVVAFWNTSDTTMTVTKLTLADGTTVDLTAADAENVSVKDKDGNTVDDAVGADGITLAAGNTIVWNAVEISADGAYEASITYTAADDAAGVLVLDREPGNYVLTDVTGAPLTLTDGAYTVGSAVVTVDNSSAYPYVAYTASETGIQAFGIQKDDAGEGTLPDTVTVTVFDVADDVYVLDYGLQVNLTDTAYSNGLFQNDSLAVNAVTEEVTFVGVQSVAEKVNTKANDYIYAYTKAGYGMETQAAEGAVGYGRLTATGTGVDTQVVYQLNQFLNGIDRYTYGVQAGLLGVTEKNVTNSTPVMEANITIMPAAIVYYEDNFASVITNGEVGGTPELSAEQGNGLKPQYGYDAIYADDSTYSNGGYTALSNADKFVFTFQGTGFDILTRTADASLNVSVYDASQFEVKTYTYTSGGVDKTGISIVRKSDAPADATALKSVIVDASYENGTIDQIPLISMKMKDEAGNLNHGTYIVLAQKTGTKEDLHVDGIRIYNPLGTGTDLENNTEVTDAYGKAEGENGASIREIRNMIFGEAYTFDYANPQDPATAEIAEGKGAVAGLIQVDEANNKLNITTGSTVIECYTGAVTSADIAADSTGTSSLLGYAVSGPNNELYLTGAEYAFGTVIHDITDASMLQIGLKAVNEDRAEGYYAVVEYKAADGTWKTIADASELKASIEMYYKIPVDDLWKNNSKSVLLVRVSNGTVSLTNLKYNHVTFEKITAASLTEGTVVEESRNSSSFHVISNGTAGTKTILTFSVSSAVTDFTVSGNDGVVFTYGTETALPEGISVGKREAGDLNIYVVKMPKNAGTYTITTKTEGSWGQAEFTIQ